MRSAFNLFVFPNSMSTPFFNERAMCSLEKWHLEITIIITIVYSMKHQMFVYALGDHYGLMKFF